MASNPKEKDKQKESAKTEKVAPAKEVNLPKHKGTIFDA